MKARFDSSHRWQGALDSLPLPSLPLPQLAPSALPRLTLLLYEFLVNTAASLVLATRLRGRRCHLQDGLCCTSPVWGCAARLACRAVTASRQRSSEMASANGY